MGDDDRTIPPHHAAEVARSYPVHAGWLFGYAYLRTGGGRELAADLVQGTFEAALPNSARTSSGRWLPGMLAVMSARLPPAV